MAVTLRHLRYFVAVADHGQVQRAAEMLRVSQPAVSQTVKELERLLGVTLFVRHPRGASLTPAGEDFYRRLTPALAAMDDAVAGVRQSVARPGGTLRIGFLPLSVNPTAREVIDAFRTARPDVRLRMRQMTFVDHWQALTDDQVDVAILYLPVSLPGVSLIPLGSEQRYVGLSTRHPLADAATLRTAQLLDYPRPGISPQVPAAFADYLALAEYGPVRFTDDAISTPEEAAEILVSSSSVLAAPACYAARYELPGLTWRCLTDAAPAVSALAMRSSGGNPLIGSFAAVARRVLAVPVDHERAETTVPWAIAQSVSRPSSTE